MTHILRNPTDDQIITAIEMNQFDFLSLINRAWSGGELHEEKDILWTISNIPFPLFNSVMRVNIDEGDVDELILRMKRLYAERHVPWTWRIGPSTHPSNLGERLIFNGLRHYDSLPGLALNLDGLSVDLEFPPGLSIIQIGNATSLGNWIEVMSESFNIPNHASEAIFDSFLGVGFSLSQPVQHFMGVINGKAVATSTLFLGAGVAGIFNVATLPEFRRKGLGEALTIAPLLQARAQGYRFAVLESSRDGLSLYRRLGFKSYCQFEQYISLPF
jgi:ribosomal protein S18 acetylase RimI-like enzyme